MTAFVVDKPHTLKMINSLDEKSPAEWRELYKDVWLFLEVTRKDEWEVYQARLVATAEDDGEFLDLARSYQEKQTAYMITRGNRQEPGPVLVAYG